MPPSHTAAPASLPGEGPRPPDPARDREERLRAALDASATGTFRWDVRTGDLDFDGNLDRLFGVAPGERVARLEDFIARVHPADRGMVVKALERCSLHGEDFDLEYRVVWPDGTARWLLDRGSMVCGEDGAPRYMTGACTDVTERRRSEESARYGARLVQAISDNAASALFMMDERGHATYMNPAAEAVTGYTLDEIRHLPLHDAIHHTRPDGRPLPMDECPLGQAFERRETLREHADVFVRRDGTFFPVIASISPVPRENATMGAVLELRDVTEQQRAQEALREALEAAEAASRAKGNFLAVVSHELRTPLNAIIGYGDLMDMEVSGTLTPAQREQLGRIRLSAWHLLDVINQILSLSRMEAGKETAVREPVSPAEMASMVASLVRPQADRKGLALAVLLPGETRTLHTDPGKLRQVLLNLLSNAVKFTERGRVELEVEAGEDAVAFHVRDTGPGIPPGDRKRIFEPFTQIDSSHTRAQGGTGLGLSISRELARLLDGEIEVRSEVGVGSTFTLRVPW